MLLLIQQSILSVFRAVSRVLTLPAAMKIHVKCRNSVYPGSEISRFQVPDTKVPWENEWKEYTPVVYTSKAILNKPWADSDLSSPDFKPKWNTLDGNINRVSHNDNGRYQFSPNGYPLNPIGRTGLSGRGLLGRWGPNHAADPIVTRWRRNSSGKKETDPTSQAPILQFVAIERRDCKQWAIPGGMVDPGEFVTATLQREFLEEALNSLERDKDQLQQIVKDFFNNGEEVYKGYVDDPRNTDNAWMETVAFNFHDEEGTSVGQFPLEAGDDAQRVAWVDLHSGLQLYASHADMLKKVAEKHLAHW